jgi:hypothetical protein
LNFPAQLGKLYACEFAGQIGTTNETSTIVELTQATSTTKASKYVRYLAAQLLTIGNILLVPNAASADELCGRHFDSLSQLYVDVRNEADHGWRVIERSTHIIMAGNEMIWAFARESQPAFPAVACLRVIQADESISAIVQTRCEGAKDACDAVVAKAKTQDWSNLFGN